MTDWVLSICLSQLSIKLLCKFPIYLYSRWKKCFIYSQEKYWYCAAFIFSWSISQGFNGVLHSPKQNCYFAHKGLWNFKEGQICNNKNTILYILHFLPFSFCHFFPSATPLLFFFFKPSTYTKFRWCRHDTAQIPQQLVCPPEGDTVTAPPAPVTPPSRVALVQMTSLGLRRETRILWREPKSRIQVQNKTLKVWRVILSVG